jgi:hypothetical protein
MNAEKYSTLKTVMAQLVVIIYQKFSLIMALNNHGKFVAFKSENVLNKTTEIPTKLVTARKNS